MNGIQSADDLYVMANAFRQSRVLLTGVELGIFTALKNGPRASDSVADELGTDRRATDRLMNALCAMGLLTKSESLFSNTDAAAQYLVRGSEGYLGNLHHLNHLWNLWSGMTEAVKSGTGVKREPVGDRGNEWLEAFIGAMHHRARTQAPQDVNLIDLHDAERALDVGGGSGIYSMAMVRVKQDLHATVFDLPEVVPLSRRYIEEAGLAHRIDTHAGDYNTDAFPGGYDLVFLSAIIHSNNPDENRKLIHKCAEALREGGQVVVQDFIMDENRVRPVHGAMFALNMLVATKAGDTYTEDEVRSWMEDAGLTDIERRDTSSGTTQVIGWKR